MVWSLLYSTKYLFWNFSFLNYVAVTVQHTKKKCKHNSTIKFCLKSEQCVSSLSNGALHKKGYTSFTCP